MTEAPLPRPECTVAFVDLAGFSALTEAHGDDDAAALADRFAELARAALGPSDRLVKCIGDAVMLAAPTPGEGITLVGRLLGALAGEQNVPLPRCGVHHGPVVERNGDLFGATVNVAARVAARAFGGQTLGTRAVADAARAAGVRVVDLGSFALKNIAAEMEVFEIHLGPRVAGGAVDPVCRMRVEREEAAGRLRFASSDYWFCSLECAAAFTAAPSRYAGTDDDT